MRSFVRAVLGALAIFAFTAGNALAQGGPKIAYINSQKILAEAPGRAEAEAQFQREMDGYKAQVQHMGDSLNALIAEYQKSESTLSATAKATKQRDIQTRQQAYQQRVAQLEQTAQQREAELVRPIMEQINKIIEQVRSENGYAFILDAGNQAGVVVAADSSLDITDQVIAKLKAAGPVASKSATPPPAPKPAGTSTKPTGVTRPKTPPNGR